MSKDTDEGEGNVYIIPGNFEEAGGVFGGIFRLRNTVEASIIAFIFFNIEKFLMQLIPITAYIVIMIVTILPTTIIALIGIKGDSLIEFVIHYFKFRKQKRVLHFRLQNTEDSYVDVPARKSKSFKIPFVKE